MVKGVSSLPDVFARLNGPFDLKQTTLEHVAMHQLDELIETTEAASVFTKPGEHRREREKERHLLSSWIAMFLNGFRCKINPSQSILRL